MQFRTQIPISASEFPIDYSSRMVSLGSCFAENMGEKFDYFKFQNLVNPFGIIFNPVSLEILVKRIVEKRYYSENDIFYHNERWNCYEVHSEVSRLDKTDFLNTLNQALENSHAWIGNATHLVITLGTSWVYRNVESNEIVANCHKVPQKEFVKELLSVNQISESLQNIITFVHSVNPDCKFIFTVSPVRHIKDGFAENNLSKAHLISAIHTMINNQSSINYFPSYEIMMDELRDYRFYAEDMLHPNKIAIDYIWERFYEFGIASDCFALMKEVEAIQKSLEHRPFNSQSEEFQKFSEVLSSKIERLTEKLPHITFTK
ncbi:GSCFA domain-containing protein [Flavobacterium sp.]|uniref:GSCFA domain-containing protein n=1 Tax=Flavobacterium sp. TaxID=239 RepID=UPI0028BF0736|nr:GSCFA domain-containing protein [Flavobacterium sp.]